MDLLTQMDTLDLIVLTVIIGGVVAYAMRRFLNKRKETAFTMGSSSASSTFANGGSASAGSSSFVDDRDFVEKMKASEANLAVFFGSQTGTAEDFAERLAGEARRYGLKALVCDIQDYDMEHLEKLHTIDKGCALFTVATYGEGEPCDNMQEFFQDTKRRRDDNEPLDLKGAHFAVFGLGNKTYEHFNAIGKAVDADLAEFGGSRIVPLGVGDDDEDMEEDFANWKEELWPALCQLHGRDASAAGMSFRMYEMTYLDEPNMDRVFTGEQGILKSYDRQRRPFTAKNPYLAKISTRRELYNDPERSCLHVELDIADSFLRYTTGDHVAVFPKNKAELVDALAKRLNLDLDRIFTMTATDSFAKKKHPFPCPCSFRTALTHYIDITSVASLNLVSELAQYAEDDAEKQKLMHMASKAGREEYHKFINKGLRSVLHVLEDFPSLNVPVDHLLELMPHLQPRYYSISSSHSQHPKSVHVTAAVVEYDTPSNRHVEGVTTKWLQRIETESVRVPIFVRHSQFRLPQKTKAPVIMIGPGTGLAPFRGFIQERAAQKAAGKEVGPTVLFFGCQKETQHFMYRDELDGFQADDVLTHLFTAFSRDQKDKVYVQHRLLEQKKLVWELLMDNAFIYVCGDAKYMARDVHNTLVKIICEEGDKSQENAEAFLKALSSQRRFQQDVWS